MKSSLPDFFNKKNNSDWVIKKIKQICKEPQYGVTEPSSFEPVGPKYLRITDIQNGKVDWDRVPYCRCINNEKYRLHPGDILFARTGATTGKSYLIKDCPEAVFASYLIRLRPKPEILPEFLFWYFQSQYYWQAVSAGIDDGNRPNMNGTKLSNLKIPFPIDKKEQRRIVSRIEELTSRADEARRLQSEAIESTKNLIQSAINECFEELRGCVKKKLGDKTICLEIKPGFACGEKEVEEGAPHLRMNNITLEGKVDFSLVRRIPVNIAEKMNKWVQIDDILFCNTNSTELVGKSCIFLGWNEPCTFSNHLTCLRVNKKAIIPKWLLICLKQLWSRGYFSQNCTEFIGQSAFNKDKLEELCIPVPPINEQHRIVSLIEELTIRADEARRLLKEVEFELDNFTPALLAKAFRGKL